MRHSFMDVAIALFLLAMILALCGIVGFLPYFVFSEGAATMLTWAVITASFIAPLMGWVSFIFVDLDFENPKRIALCVAVLCFIVTISPSVSLMSQGCTLAAYNREMAPKAQSVVMALFDRIDVLKDGTLTNSELASAAGNRSFTAQERLFITYIRDQQATAGHVIASYNTTTYIWISIGKGSGYLSPISTTAYIYGITKEDLKGFVSRINSTYKNW